MFAEMKVRVRMKPARAYPRSKNLSQPGPDQPTSRRSNRQGCKPAEQLQPAAIRVWTHNIRVIDREHDD